MPDGDFRRPPQLWEQKLAQLVASTSVGMVSGAGTDPSFPDSPPGDGGPGIEPDPVIPAPVDFIAPSTPTVTGTVQGLRVSWDGLNADGNAYPPGAYVEVHYSTSGATFTPSSSTLAGTLLGSAGFFSIMGLTAGVTYYVRLVGVDAAGNRTAPSTAASSQTGLTTTNDYGTATITSGAVSFDARAIGGITTTVGTTAPTGPVTGDIWLDSTGGSIVHKRWSGSSWVTQAWGSSSISAGAVTATQIAAGAVTAGAIAANAITADKINAGAVTADKIAADAISGKTITGGTIEGAEIRSASSGRRVVIGKVGETTDIQFVNSSGVTANLGIGADNTNLYASTGISNGSFVSVMPFEAQTSFVTSFIGANRAFRVGSSGGVFAYGIEDNPTALAANVRVGGSAQLLRSTSTQQVKDNIISLGGDLVGVDPAKISSEPASVNPYDVLEIAPVEFQSLAPTDGGQRLLGFIAENVVEVFPWAAEWNEAGEPSSVADRPIIAALLAVVRDQQAAIADLTARVTALESA